MRKRESVIRAALTRYHAGQRLRILSYENDALDREGLRELDMRINGSAIRQAPHRFHVELTQALAPDNLCHAPITRILPSSNVELT